MNGVRARPGFMLITRGYVGEAAAGVGAFKIGDSTAFPFPQGEVARVVGVWCGVDVTQVNVRHDDKDWIGNGGANARRPDFDVDCPVQYANGKPLSIDLSYGAVLNVVPFVFTFEIREC